MNGNIDYDFSGGFVYCLIMMGLVWAFIWIAYA